LTQPEGPSPNPHYGGGEPGLTSPPGLQPPAGYPFQQQPTQQFGPPQGYWPPPAHPGAGLPRPPRRPWFKQKRFAIPAGLLAVAVLGAAVSPKTDTNTASSSAAASTTKDYGYMSSDPKDVSVAPTTQEAPTTAAASSRAPVAGTSAPTSKSVPAPAPKPAPAPAPAPVPNVTVSQQNALRAARDYLDYTSFARTELIDQLKYEGYSTSDATWAVDSLNVDWNAQAALKAKDYLNYTSFSHSGLVDQLEYDGFTAAQAEYGVSQAGL
jgi:hypothetical protein